MRPSRIERSLWPALDLRSIGLFRVLVGLNLIFDLLLRKLPYVGPFYTDGGVVPRHLLEAVYGSRSISLLHFSGGAPSVYAFFAFTLACYVLYTVGFHSRIAGGIAYVCLWSIHQRDPFIIYGVDYIYNALLFFSLFLPLDARFAVRTSGSDARVPKLAAVAILLQISFIYLVSGASKSGTSWRDGTAIAIALTDTIHTTAAGVWLSSQALLCRLLTWSTLVFEWLVGPLIFFPVHNAVTRSFAIVGILAFNWGLAPFLHLGPFYLTALAQAALLVPRSVWDRWGVVRSAEPPRELRPRSWQRLSQPLLAVCVAALVWSNTYTIVHMGLWSRASSAWVQRIWPSSYRGWEYSSILSQDWSFFAPDPSPEAGWLAVTGELEDGEYMELHAPRSLGWTVSRDAIVGDVRDLYGSNARPASRPRPHDPGLHSGAWKDLVDGARRMWRDPAWARLLGQWAAYEADVWDRQHPERRVARVDLVLVSVDAAAAIEDRPADPTPYVLQSFSPGRP